LLDGRSANALSWDGCAEGHRFAPAAGRRRGLRAWALAVLLAAMRGAL
jgi:hypothetical protein